MNDILTIILDFIHANARADIIISVAIPLTIFSWIFRSLHTKETPSPGYKFTEGNPRKREIINRLRKNKKLDALPPPYPNGWFLLFQSHELDKGVAKEVSVLGLDLVAWRGESGQAYVADAYCPHLGAHLGVGGVVSQECITCPFHGWQFQGSDGTLTNIPYSNFEKLPHAKIKTHTILEQQGVIYIWYHAEGEEPSWFPSTHPNIKSGKWICTMRHQEFIEGHIHDIMENSADFTHSNSLHRFFYETENCRSFFRRILQETFTMHFHDGRWSCNKNSGEKHCAVAILEADIILFKWKKLVHSVIETVEEGPGMFFAHVKPTGFTDFGLEVFITPVDNLTQMMTVRVFAGRMTPKIMSMVYLQFFRSAIDQDKPVFARKIHLNKPCLAKEDAPIKAFKSYYSQFYSDNSLPIGKSRFDLDF